MSEADPARLAATLSEVALLVLAHAARRRGARVIAPPGLFGAAADAVMAQLVRRGLITDARRPVLTDLGIRVVAAYLLCEESDYGGGD